MNMAGRESEEDAKKRLFWMAMDDPFLGPPSLKSGVEGMRLITLPSGEHAGFIMPMAGSGKYQRVGTIYIDPKYRGKGVGRDFVTHYFKDKFGQSWIRRDNKPSQNTFKAAGFYKTGRTSTVNGNFYEEWVNKPQTMDW